MNDTKMIEVIWLDKWWGNPATRQLGDLIVEGSRIPLIEVSRSVDMAKDGEIKLTLDRRYGLTTTDEELSRWGWFLANAMAVSAGFSSIDPNAQRRLDSFFGTGVAHIDPELLGSGEATV